MSRAYIERVLIWGACLVGWVAPSVSAQEASAGDPTAPLRDRLVREAAPPTLEATWYRPHEEEPGQTNPLAVILASEHFPVSTKDYWVPTLWKQNFCTLVLATEGGKSWSGIRTPAVLKELLDPPEEVSSDSDRLLLIADAHTGPLAMQLMNGLAERLLGAVFINVTPVEISPTGPALWQPRTEVWRIPIWSVVGTQAKQAGKTLELWRKVAARAPSSASLTIDTRPDRGRGHLLPDPAISVWLESVHSGRRPAPGPDRQVEAERKQYAKLATEIRQAVQNDTDTLPAGKKLSKTDGPFTLSVLAPQHWWRDREAEKAYHPQGPQIDAKGRMLDEGRSPYAEMYFTPKRRGPFFVRVRATEGTGDGAKLLGDFEQLVAAKGYLPVSLERWTSGPWTYDVSSYLLLWRDHWHRWIILTAASETTPAAPLIMVMDATGAPAPQRLARTLRYFLQSTRVGRSDTGLSTAPKTLE